jgi:hypothetical protein
VYGPHQNRWNGNFDNVVKYFTTLKIQDWRFTNFEHLYDVIRTIFLLNGHRNAYLTIYDSALRIGYNHKEQILPSKFVYLYGNKVIGPLGTATTIYGQKWIYMITMTRIINIVSKQDGSQTNFRSVKLGDRINSLHLRELFLS